MNTILSSLVLMTTMIYPDISYHIVTDEFHQHNTYSYSGTIVHNTPSYVVYAVNDDACRLKNNSVYYNIIDELVLVGNRITQKNSFSLEKDVYNRCLLRINKVIHKHNNNRYIYQNYWYPDYNRIYVKPKRNFRKHHRAGHRNTNNTIIVSPRQKPQRSASNKSFHKRHTKKIVKFHKNKIKNKKNNKKHYKLKKKFKKMRY